MPPPLSRLWRFALCHRLLLLLGDDRFVDQLHTLRLRDQHIRDDVDQVKEAVRHLRMYRLKVASWTVVREPGQPSPRLLSDHASVAAPARELIPDDDREHFLAFYLNSQNRLLFFSEISVGTQTATLVHPREVFGPALREGAAAIVVCHNHPSGEVTPSREDVRLTKQLVKAGELLDLKVHDHVVVCHGTAAYACLSQRGELT